MQIRSGTLTRVIAIDALVHVLNRRVFADVALEKLFHSHPELRSLDRSFVFEIVYGTLRWLSKMDWIMQHLLDRPLLSLDPRVLNALRVGCYQIFYMDRVPDRAAVSETVEAVKEVGMARASSYVNAILRRIASRAEYFTKPDKETQPIEYLSLQFAHPTWMVERWYKNLSLERLEYLLKSNNEPPLQNLIVVPTRPLPDDETLSNYLLRQFGISSHWRPLHGVLQVNKLPPLEKCEAFQAGCYYIQDEAAHLVSSLVRPQAQDTILDACAAPGGKTMALWVQGALPSQLTVCDLTQKRVSLIRSNFKRVGLDNVRIEQGDCLSLFKEEKFSKIFLDAPCSSLGVMRRHPEMKWLKTQQDIENCALQQQQLLEGLVSLLEPEGELIYSVCSNEQEETSEQIGSFLSRHGDFKVLPLEGRLHDYYKKYINRDYELSIFPGNTDQLDGFYAVVLKKDFAPTASE